MLKILNFKDIDNSNLDLGIKIYLTLYLTHLVSVYKTMQIQNNVSFIFLENADDCLNYKDIGLTAPIKDTAFEYCEKIVLNEAHAEITLLHGLYICNNDFSIDIYVDENFLDNETKQSMLSNLL